MNPVQQCNCLTLRFVHPLLKAQTCFTLQVHLEHISAGEYNQARDCENSSIQPSLFRLKHGIVEHFVVVRIFQQTNETTTAMTKLNQNKQQQKNNNKTKQKPRKYQEQTHSDRHSDSHARKHARTHAHRIEHTQCQ